MNRREAISGMTMGAALAIGGGTGVARAAATASAGGDLDSEAGKFRAFMMVKGALDDRLVVRWISARYYAAVDEALTPMYNTHSATLHRFRKITEGKYTGGFEMVSAEIAWFTDLETGRALDRWYNPMLDRYVDIPMGGLPASRAVLTPQLELHHIREANGTSEYKVLPFETRPNDLWITERVRTAVPREGMKPFRYSQNSIYRTTLSALSQPGAQHVTSDVSFTNICSWRPYLEMGDHPGHMTSFGIGQQGARLENAPEQWKIATRERMPAVYKDPSSLLAELWETKLKV